MVCYNITAYNKIINFTVSKREVYYCKLRTGIKAERGMVMKGKNLERAVILGLLLSTGVYGTAWAEDLIGNDKNNRVEVNYGQSYDDVYGIYEKDDAKEVIITKEGTVIINDGGKVLNATGSHAESYNYNTSVEGGHIFLYDGAIVGDKQSNSSGNVSGNYAFSWSGDVVAKNGTVDIYGGEIINPSTYGVHGSFAHSQNGSTFADGGTVNIYNGYIEKPLVTNGYNGVIGSEAKTIYGDAENVSARAQNGKINIYGGTMKGYVLGNLAYVNSGQGDAKAYNGIVNINEVKDTINIEGSVRGGYARTANGSIELCNNDVIMSSGNVTTDVSGGYGIISNGNSAVGNSGNIIINDNTVQISGGNVKNIYGSFATNYENGTNKKITINDNNIFLSKNAKVTGDVYAAVAQFTNSDSTSSIEVKNNKIFVKDSVDLSNANLHGSAININENGSIINSGNDLIVDGWMGKEVNSLNDFNNIKFQNIEWENEGVVIDVLNNNATSSLENTNIDLRESTNLAGGTKLNVNDYMYFIKTDNGTLGTKDKNILVNQNSNGDNIFTAGVAFEGTGEVSVEDNGNVKYTIKDVKATDQTESVGKGASIAAAFLVTGGDLVVEGLNAMEQDQLFGTKTFAIVEGHKSTYDVADDLKINGCNGLYGVGNIKQLEDGNWSYAAFFENGIANYRTYNSFLGETFRGDGTVVYNGGGLAGRYKKNNGVYAEASLRAGLLKNDMENIFRDGNGNNYGYKTETPYYAFHAGIGKLFSVNESTDWDLYTRYYHTYNDGDNFSVAGDKFEVDSFTSDRLRVGARYITNKHNQWSTYYGLAWEYEFNGDADVKVNGTSLETETLEGSSYFAEIGFNYQKEKTSPWSFEGRMRGYAGVRDGISGILRATYSF